MIQNLKEYEVVVPYRVKPGGQQLDVSEDHYLRRGKRDLYSSEHLSNLAYKFNIGSNEFMLDLKPYNSFMSPNMVVQYLDSNRTWAKDGSDWKHCFYSGTVNKDSQSKATLSICEHLVCTHILILLQHDSLRYSYLCKGPLLVNLWQLLKKICRLTASQQSELLATTPASMIFLFKKAKL